MKLPGPAWDELPGVEPLETWPPQEPLPGVEALVAVVARVGPEELALLPDLRLVANYGGGYDLVDVAACRGRGVSVTNTPRVPERLLELTNVVLTPHIASASVETRAAMTRVLVDNVLAFLGGEPLPNEVDA